MFNWWTEGESSPETRVAILDVEPSTLRPRVHRPHYIIITDKQKELPCGSSEIGVDIDSTPELLLMIVYSKLNILSIHLSTPYKTQNHKIPEHS